AIYFDSNEPVITNTTLHTINYCLFKDTHASIDATSCGSFIAPDGQVYDQSGTYTAVLVNAAGCDSTITIHLQSIVLDPQVAGNGSGTLTASPAGLNYQWIDCSTNTVIEGETASTFTGSNGIYAVQVSDGVCMEQSECAELVSVGELNSQAIRVFPIPSSQSITAVWDGANIPFTITSPDGRVLQSGRLIAGNNTIDISRLASGNYFLKAGNRVTRFVVK
ncbi:MAG: T9SS type A sorting domain-containing protein, partial [Flavobacteriales bacterium]